MIWAVILAAGQSRRLPPQKLLLPIGGRPLIAWTVDAVLASGVAGTVVVTGHARMEVEAALTGRPGRFAINPDPESDMLGSVRIGLRALPATATAVLLVLGDQPRVSAGTIRKILATPLTQERGIVVPTWQGKRGHPILFSLAYRDEVLNRFDGQGLRGLLNAHPEAVVELEVATDEVLQDVDVRDDYARIREGLGHS